MLKQLAAILLSSLISTASFGQKNDKRSSKIRIVIVTRRQRQSGSRRQSCSPQKTANPASGAPSVCAVVQDRGDYYFKPA